MSSPILTIIIPTYKRSASLAILLQTLREETVAVADEVQVYVSDNCSPDDTSQIVTNAGESWPTLRYHRHLTNVGPERNFLHAVKQAQTRWFWIIGDDDLPKRGVVAKVLSLLRQRQPALLFMNSEWMTPVLNADQGEQVKELRVAEMDSLLFARTVNTWLTFISGMVIDREKLGGVLAGRALDRFDNTSLIQLGWVLPLLNTGGPFLIIKDRAILATSENTGGYQVLNVFCANFPMIVKDFFKENQALRDAILNEHISKYLPALLWNYRFGNMGNFQPEGSENLVRKQFGAHFKYWLILWPIMSFPKALALIFYASSRLLAKFQA